MVIQLIPAQAETAQKPHKNSMAYKEGTIIIDDYFHYECYKMFYLDFQQKWNKHWTNSQFPYVWIRHKKKQTLMQTQTAKWIKIYISKLKKKINLNRLIPNLG